jgi:adenylate cyclase
MPAGFVSNTVYDQVRDRLPFLFEDLGEQQVKNIARPVRVYRLRPERPLPSLPPQAGEGSARSARVGAAELPPVLPLPDKPSIAVLPFQNMSGDPEQEYFADGMVEEITTALSRIRWLFVIARNSSFTYKAHAIDVKQVGRELGVRYVLEGSVRKAGGRMRSRSPPAQASRGMPTSPCAVASFAEPAPRRCSLREAGKMCFDVSIPIRLICSTDGLLCLRSRATSFWHA